MKWVSGRNLDTVCINTGVPSREKNTPENIIIGKVIRFINPLASSSLFRRAAKISPNEIIQRIASIVIRIIDKYNSLLEKGKAEKDRGKVEKALILLTTAYNKMQKKVGTGKHYYRSNKHDDEPAAHLSGDKNKG